MMEKPLHIEAVILRFEGILAPSDENTSMSMKKAIGCPAECSIVEFIRSLQGSVRQKNIISELENLEIKAAVKAKPEAHAEAMLHYLQSADLKLGLISEKSSASIQRALKNFKSIQLSDIDIIISRDDLVRQTAEVDGITIAAEKMELDFSRILVLSSQVHDIQSSKDNGSVSVFFSAQNQTEFQKTDDVFMISNFEELKRIVRMGISLPAGKLPNDLLREFLDDFVFDDPSILINPGVGEDIAAVDVEAEQVLVLKSDPITFATDSIGQYAVLINANDIATSGAVPRWLLTTLLFPHGVTASEIRKVVMELKEFCHQWGITLCGGHTEISDVVSRPVVAGMMAGTVARSDLIDKRNMAVGDKVLLTKRVAVEGTAILAREFGERLRHLGMNDAEIETCRGFLSDISIIPEAKIAAQFSETNAMHDITEGGLATALEELSIAGGHRIRIDFEKIPVFPETRKICRLLNIDPLGLIGSGSLLICSQPNAYQNVIAAIRDAGVEVACIGEVIEEGHGIEAMKQGKRVDWPSFEVDEITKLF
ncbi:MAG: AIR synthase family protein [Desulfobacterales bacterium]|jgi:hydrogenase maturation factor/phosphoglycolate phosphatase-like HAD superfamily hydrolase